MQVILINQIDQNSQYNMTYNANTEDIFLLEIPELNCDFSSIHFAIHLCSLISCFSVGTISRFSMNQTSKTPNPADSLSICTRVDQREQRRSRAAACILYILTSIPNIQLISIAIKHFPWFTLPLNNAGAVSVLVSRVKGSDYDLLCVYLSDFHQTAHRPPFFGTTELWLLSGALWFLGETRIEVVELAVIQRKCAKCYQNWINRQQLRLMKGIEQEKGSFQVTHEWNFKLYAICWMWVPILQLLCCDIVIYIY